ncbi:AtpZ/AtpI family protein [Chloroflexota bacterium]
MTGGGLDLSEQIWYAPLGMERWRLAMRLVGVGWYIGLCIFLGVWGGIWLDKWLDTKPLFVIAGLILGLTIAVYGVYRMLIPAMSDNQDKENG